MPRDPHDHDGLRRERVAQIARAARDLHAVAQQYRRCFTTDAGRKVLENLQACYGGSTTGHSPRQTELHSAQRDVLMRIEDLIALAAVSADEAVEELSRRKIELENLNNPWSRYERRQ
jgi:hypothetical protein